MTRTIGELQTVLFAGDITTASQVSIGVGFGTPEDSQQFPFDELLLYAAQVGLSADQTGIHLDLDSLNVGIPNSSTDFIPFTPPGGPPQRVLIEDIIPAATGTDLSAGAVTATTIAIDSSTGTSATLFGATGAAAGIMVANDKARLDAIQDNANNYVHPDHTGEVTSTGDGATVIADGAVVTDRLADLNVTEVKIAPDAISSAKIQTDAITNDELAAGAVEIANLGTTAQTNLGNTPAADTLDVTSSTGTSTTLPAATGTTAGVLSSTDFNRFEGGLQTRITPEGFGAANDDSTDDSLAVQNAIDAAGDSVLYLLRGAGYRIVTPLVVTNNNLTIIGEGPGASRLTTAVNWQDNPVLTISGNNCNLEHFSIEETGASPTNAAKAGQANNAGLSLESRNNFVLNVKTNGFGFGVLVRSLGDATRDDNQLAYVDATNAYGWGIEVDSAQNVQVIACKAHRNGLSGLKQQNEGSRLATGLVVDRFEGFLNGQRDIAAGGVDDTVGNGINLYNGGYRFTISNSRCYQNFGSGFVMKGTLPVEPQMGEGLISNCDFNDAAAVNLGVTHGVELSSVFHPNLQFTNCRMSGNSGNGLNAANAFNFNLAGCQLIQNKDSGMVLQGSCDLKIRDTNIMGSLGTYGILIGVASNDTFANKRILISGCNISGNYDPNLTEGEDPRSASTTVSTIRGIEILSDSAGVVIENTHVYNVRDYCVSTNGQNIVIKDSYFYDHPSFGILQSESDASLTVERCWFQNALTRAQFGSGSGPVPQAGETVTDSFTAGTGVLKAIEITSGSFATNDAAGSFWIYDNVGTFANGATLTFSGGATAITNAIDTPRAIRVNLGQSKIVDNIFSLETSRGSSAIYVQAGADTPEISNNSVTNYSPAVIQTPVLSNGVTYREDTAVPSGSEPGVYHVQQGSARGAYVSSGVGEPLQLIPFDQDGTWPIF